MTVRPDDAAASASLDGPYFERLYAEKRDPWNFESSPYELDKYRATLDLLGTARFRAALEIGCSVGVLTSMLAPQCDALLAIDINARALASARRRCENFGNVRFAEMAYPRESPLGAFDLILLSEVGYYWSDDDLALAIERIARSGRGGTLELVHFLPKVDDYIRDGDDVHHAFSCDPRFTRQADLRAEKYRIDIFHIA